MQNKTVTFYQILKEERQLVRIKYEKIYNYILTLDSVYNEKNRFFSLIIIFWT